MVTSDNLRDQARQSIESQYGQFVYPSQPAKVRALPESPTQLLSPRMRRVESSPPVIMGTPSPPLFPNNGTLTVRKRRKERPATIHFASQNILSIDDDDQTAAVNTNHISELAGEVLLEKSGSRSRLSAFVTGKLSTGVQSTTSEVTEPLHHQQENVPIYFDQLTRQDLPGGGLQRRDSGKRKALARMIDGAKSKYPRISQRSFTSGGLLRRTSTKSVPSQHAWTKSWDAKETSENPRSSLDTTLVDQSFLEPPFFAATDMSMTEDVASHEIFDKSTFSFTANDGSSDTRVIQPYGTVPPLSKKDHAIMTVQLNILPEIDELRGDEEDVFWVGVEAEAVAHCSSNRNEVYHRRFAPSSYGEVTDVILAVEACPGCSIESVVGQSSKPVLRAYESTLILMVKIRVDSYSLTPKSCLDPEKEPADADSAFHDLETFLGESLMPIFNVECRYNNSLLPRASDIVVLETCYLRRTSYDVLWSPSQESRYDDWSHSNHDLHAKLILCLASEMAPDEALQELDQTFTKRQCVCPQYLEKVRRYLNNRIATEEADGGRSLQYSFAAPSPPKPALPRRSFETRKLRPAGLNNAAARYPAHVILPLGGLKSTGITRGQSFDETTDRAQEIWRHMRNKSRGEESPHRSTTDTLKNLHDLDRPLWEIRRQALSNKRSVGADTLKSLAVSTRGFGEGVHAPWL